MIKQMREILKKIYDNSVKIIDKECPKCKKTFKTKSGPSGYINCKECNSK